MSNSRTEIFSRLQQASSDTAQGNATGSATIKKHLSAHKRGVLPVYSESILDRFISKVENVEATVKCIKNTSNLSAAVYEYMSQHGIELNLVAAPSETLKKVNWQKEITIEYRRAHNKDMSTLTMAYAGIAETGSLVLCSSKKSPTTLNFLPDNNICIILTLRYNYHIFIILDN